MLLAARLRAMILRTRKSANGSQNWQTSWCDLRKRCGAKPIVRDDNLFRAVVTALRRRFASGRVPTEAGGYRCAAPCETFMRGGFDLSTPAHTYMDELKRKV